MFKILYLLCGAAGSGKSTLAKLIVEATGGEGPFEADTFMIGGDGKYKFVPERLGYCHACCQGAVEGAMRLGASTIVTSNTNLNERERKPYKELAARYGYRVVEVGVMSDFESVHNVPAEKIAQMKERFVFGYKNS